MSKTENPSEITVEASNIEEGVEKALSILHVSREEVDVKIIREASTSLFGIIKKPLLISVKVKEKDIFDIIINEFTQNNIEISTATENNVTNVLNGTISIENGKLVVSDPVDGIQAMITPGESISIFVNDKQIYDTVSVSSKDKIELQLPEEQPISEILISISEDEMEASLMIKNTPGWIYSIKDAEPSVSLTVHGHKEKQIYPALISVEEAKEKLLERGVLVGLDMDALHKACSTPDESIVVARGKSPKPGKDGFIKMHFAEKPSLQVENDKVDLFSFGTVTTVNPGNILATKHPPAKGENGQTVLGNPALPPPPKEVKLIARNGVKLNNKGNIAISLITGKPEIHGKSEVFIAVNPVFTVSGDVDNTTGNIKFGGNVVVTGNVTDNFKVEARGDIIIHGMVTHGRLNALGNIYVGKGVVSSHLEAGGNSTLVHNLIYLLQGILSPISEMLQALEQVKTSPAFKAEDLDKLGYGRFFQLLLDTKFPLLSKKIKKIGKVISESNIGDQLPELATIVDDLKILTGINALKIQTEQEVRDLLSSINNILQLLRTQLDSSSEIQCLSADNSSLLASGDIKILGKGTYHSILESCKNISVLGNPGHVIGGHISVLGSLSINKIGSKLGNATQIILRGKKDVFIGEIINDVAIYHGGQKTLINEPKMNFIMKSNQKGQNSVNSKDQMEVK